MINNIHKRQSHRIKNYDYSQSGAYFITICIQNRECFLGEINNGIIILNDAGKMIQFQWNDLQRRFNIIELNEYIIMPNHIHSILIINNRRGESCIRPEKTGKKTDEPKETDDYIDIINNRRGESCIRPEKTDIKTDNHIKTGDHKDRPYGTINNSIGRIIQAFKSITTHEYTIGVKQYNWPPFNGKLWQRNYYEHVIRNEHELNKIREYIINNPLKWDLDVENPVNINKEINNYGK